MVRRGLASLRGLEIGSAAIAGAELSGLLSLLPDAEVFVHYGLTECSRATLLDVRKHPDKLDTVGRPRPGVELAVVDDTGRPAAAGQVGQILVRGPQMARAYHRGPDLQVDPLVEGWLATGDYGAIDRDGFLSYRGRRDDLINCAGHTFSPAEVETELGAPAGVVEYLVTGVPDSRGILGEMPVALVVPSEPETFDPASFTVAARDALPPHMVPRKVRAVEALPRTDSGKPDRRRAAAQFADPEEPA